MTLCHVNRLPAAGVRSLYLSHTGTQAKHVHVQLELHTTGSGTDIDGYGGQEWFEDDFGLKTKREAEKLRLKQLQIEQEIEELQAQAQHEANYFYIREIPNKPPPPYTPPGQADRVPSSEAAVTELMGSLSAVMWEAIQRGATLGDLAPPDHLWDTADTDAVRCYKSFLFDLAKHIAVEVTQLDEDTVPAVPWLRPAPRLSRQRGRVVPRTLDAFRDAVVRQTLYLFGMRKRVAKESLIVRWSRKKRDHVDELLVSESQAEEAQWTRYDEDQVTVKNEVTTAILDALLVDTVAACSAAFSRRCAQK